MFTAPLHHRLLPTLLVAAAIPLAAPGLAHAASPHGPAGPPPAQGAHPGRPVAVEPQRLRIAERGGQDDPADGSV
jgi:hypothetical protein